MSINYQLTGGAKDKSTKKKHLTNPYEKVNPVIEKKVENLLFSDGFTTDIYETKDILTDYEKGQIHSRIEKEMNQYYEKSMNYDSFLLYENLREQQRSDISLLNEKISRHQVMDEIDKAIFNCLYDMATCREYVFYKRAVLYRGMGHIKKLDKFKSLEPNPGMQRLFLDKPIIHTEGFWGFSLDESTAADFMRNKRNVAGNWYKVLIVVPFVGEKIRALTGTGDENEFVFSPGTRLEVIKSVKVNNYLKLFVRIQPHTVNVENCSTEHFTKNAAILNDILQYDDYLFKTRMELNGDYEDMYL